MEFCGRRSLPCKTVFTERTSDKIGSSRIQGRTYDGLCFSAVPFYDCFQINRWKAEKRWCRVKPACMDECNFFIYHADRILFDSIRNKLPVWRKHNSGSNKVAGVPAKVIKSREIKK